MVQLALPSTGRKMVKCQNNSSSLRRNPSKENHLLGKALSYSSYHSLSNESHKLTSLNKVMPF